MRILFRNQLPVGSGGNLFVPVDTTVMGAGMGPDMGGMLPADRRLSSTMGHAIPCAGWTPSPLVCFTENRATLHLHGGMTPWISDGTPHQWITPVRRAAYPDSTYPENEGVSVSNVPDMPDPGPRGADVLLHQPAERPADVLPRPCLGHHPPERVCGRGRRLPGDRRDRTGSDGSRRRTCRPRHISAFRSIIQDKTFVPTPDQLAPKTRPGTPPSGAETATCGFRTSTCPPRTRATQPG